MRGRVKNHPSVFKKTAIQNFTILNPHTAKQISIYCEVTVFTEDTKCEARASLPVINHLNTGLKYSGETPRLRITRVSVEVIFING